MLAGRMRFHALLVLRDEGDLIGQTLDHLLSWADSIAVLDTGSTDDTWDVVQDRARHDRRVVPIGREAVVFSENLRGYVFDRQRSAYEPGDWVLRVDADEVYHVPPPRFVAERMRPGESAAHLQWYYFRLTRQEADDYGAGRVDVTAAAGGGDNSGHLGALKPGSTAGLGQRCGTAPRSSRPES
jgi:hypothetical protein